VRAMLPNASPPLPCTSATTPTANSGGAGADRYHYEPDHNGRNTEHGRDTQGTTDDEFGSLDQQAEPRDEQACRHKQTNLIP
jgi:hypothetical protein